MCLCLVSLHLPHCRSPAMEVKPTRADTVERWGHDLYIEEEQVPRKDWEKQRVRHVCSVWVLFSLFLCLCTCTLYIHVHVDMLLHVSVLSWNTFFSEHSVFLSLSLSLSLAPSFSLSLSLPLSFPSLSSSLFLSFCVGCKALV